MGLVVVDPRLVQSVQARVTFVKTRVVFIGARKLAGQRLDKNGTKEPAAVGGFD